jgi:hypothetical protein
MDEGRRLMDVWSGLGVSPHPAIYYVVTAPLDLDVIVRSPLVLTRTVRYRRIAGEPVESDSTTDIGGVVRNTSGEPVAGASLVLEGSAREPVFTNVLGQYLISAVARGALRVRVTPPGGKARAVALNVPAASYDIILE